MAQRLRIGAAGLGRMGARHAINFLHRAPRAELVAAFTPDPKELAWAKVNLEPHGVKLYKDYDETIKQEGLQTVIIIFRSQTCDKHDPGGFFVEYAAWSGGVFVDMSVHDIDLALWFFGDDIREKSVSAYGVRAIKSELAKYNDFGNALGIVEFWDDRVANFYCSRMMAYGQEDVTEIIGTTGKLAVNGNPQKNLVNYYGPQGVTREVPAHYYGRFEQAFVGEANEFAAACLDDMRLSLNLRNAVKAVEIGLVKGTQIRLNEAGQRISDTSTPKL
ncbi:unnamed protein product [Aureobasidium vineae]|uniref:GFO/IDH/MocA-like oxidoreductase domain-containing protein n=1 Tax=Aureobasidium vineae TaxID=2773715 RepID=A0A9N8JM95_9PEZI|nr:unnamed protein product [Aureobasidium vineae]